MLTSADLELVNRERHLPGIRTALDADSLLEYLAARWPHGVTAPTGASIDYLRYKPGTSLLAGVTLHTAAGTSNAFVKACGPGSVAKLAKLRASGEEDPIGWGALVDDELRLAAVDATSDRRLPGLRELLVTTTAQVEPLRYKPERRWVGVLGRNGRRDLLVKIHRRGLLPDMSTEAQYAFSVAGLPVPKLLESSPESGLLAYEWIPGTPLDESPPTPTQLAETGDLLARLHTIGLAKRPTPGSDGTPTRPVTSTTGNHPSPPDGWRSAGSGHGAFTRLRTTPNGVPPSSPDRASELAEAVDAVAAVLPGCSTVAQSAAFSAFGALPAVASTMVHGDFSADQVIARPSGLAIVDLDRARADDPAADLASWVAAEMVSGRASTDANPVDVLGPLLETYQAESGIDVRDRLDAHTAIALLRRAVDPFRTRLPDWPARVLAVVHAADRLAHRASTR